MPKNDPNKTYIGVLPLLIEFFVTRPIGSEFSFEKLASETGFSYRQVRTSLIHANSSGRLNVPPSADMRGVVWQGLGPNAKLADRDRMAKASPVSGVIGVATEPIAAGGTGEIRLNGSASRKPVGEYLSPAVHGPGCYALVRELKDGALLLEDGHGELYKAVRI